MLRAELLAKVAQIKSPALARQAAEAVERAGVDRAELEHAVRVVAACIRGQVRLTRRDGEVLTMDVETYEKLPLEDVEHTRVAPVDEKAMRLAIDRASRGRR